MLTTRRICLEVGAICLGVQDLQKSRFSLGKQIRCKNWRWPTPPLHYHSHTQTFASVSLSGQILCTVTLLTQVALLILWMIAFDNVQKLILQLPFSGLLPTFESCYFLKVASDGLQRGCGAFDTGVPATTPAGMCPFNPHAKGLKSVRARRPAQRCLCSHWLSGCLRESCCAQSAWSDEGVLLVCRHSRSSPCCCTILCIPSRAPICDCWPHSVCACVHEQSNQSKNPGQTSTRLQWVEVFRHTTSWASPILLGSRLASTSDYPWPWGQFVIAGTAF